MSPAAMDTLVPGVLSRQGVEIRYWTGGPANAPLVVFCHGATLDHRMFDRQAGALTSAGYRVLLWDLPGHGESKPIGDEFGTGSLAQDLAAILDRLEIGTATIIGHSFGGYVAQEFVRRFPDRVAALGIIGCTDLSRKPSILWGPLRWIMPGLLARGTVEDFRRRTLENLSVSPAVRDYAMRAMAGIGKQEFISIILAGFDCLARDQGFPQDYRIGKPFLLTHGALDKANGGVFPRQAPSWMAKEPHGRYEIIPDAGHTANADNPDAFNAILLAFLEDAVRRQP